MVHVPLDCIVVQIAQFQCDFAKNPRIAVRLETQNVVDLLRGHRSDLDQEVSDSVWHLAPLKVASDSFCILSRMPGLGIGGRIQPRKRYRFFNRVAAISMTMATPRTRYVI